MAEKIMEVHEVRCEIAAGAARSLTVFAKGEVNSSGWTEPRLEPHVYVAPPEDGIQGFDFVAQEPDGLRFWATEFVTAEYAAPCESWVKGVRIHAQGSEKHCLC
jgi:hypothetical protein